jgi:hypothetical protein
MFVRQAYEMEMCKEEEEKEDTNDEDEGTYKIKI